MLVVGASGVGKSTLCEQVARTIPTVIHSPSNTSSIAAKYGGWDAVRTDAKARLQLQIDIHQQKLNDIEQALTGTHVNWVVDGLRKPHLIFDRFFECACYGNQEAYAHGVFEGQISSLVARFRQMMLTLPVRHVPFIFFVRPHPDVLRIAREKDNGRRSEYLTDARVYRVDGAIEQVLTGVGDVGYVSIDSPTLKDRLATVGAVVKLYESVVLGE